MAILMQRSLAPSVLAIAAALALASYGCVFENKCVGAGVTRGADGKCTATGPMMDAGTSTDAGTRDGGALDSAADLDSGPPAVDSGPAEIVVEVAAGAAHLCARTNLGAVYCRGHNGEGQLAAGDTLAHAGLQPVVFDRAVASIAGTHTSVCAVSGLPAAYCWGGNANGQVGDGLTAAQITTPFHLPFGNVVAMASSFANTCMTASGGGATQCWGRNDVGQLGFDSGGADVTSPAMPVQWDSGSGARSLEFVTEIAIGDRHICFRTVGATNNVLCAGENMNGQLGVMGHASSSLALRVPGLSDVRSIAAAGQHACAVEGESVYCWGDNMNGQVDPTAPGASLGSPTLVAAVTGARQVVTGMDSSCALLTSGEVKCWGARMYGGIGDGIVDGTVTTPKIVVGLTGIRQLSSSFVELVCALDDSGVVSCWGSDAASLLGGGTTSAVFPDTVVLHSLPVVISMLP